MEKEKNYKRVIAILFATAVLLTALCLLFATVTISLKGSATQGPVENNTNNNETYDALAIAKEKMPVVLSFIKQTDGVYTYCGKSVNSDMTKDNLLYLKSTQFKSLEELKNYLTSVMTKEMFNMYFLTGENKYVEKDGLLYCSYVPADGLATHYMSEDSINKLDNLSYNILNKTDNSFEASLTFTYSSAIEEVTNELHTFNASFVKENNIWLVNSLIGN